MTGVRWDRARFAHDAATVAEGLLGARLVSVSRSGARVSGIIVETEAYVGVEDRASHAVGGRRTARNEAMYAKPGTAYVYFTYGMHHCFNVVCGAEGEPAAALVRALRPEEGLALIRRRRGPGRSDRELCSGPGRLCQALGIDLRLNGADLVSGARLFIEDGRPVDGVVRARRIGVDYAGDWAAAELRWLVAGDPHVSRPARNGSESGVRRGSGPIGSSGPRERRISASSGRSGVLR